MRTQFDTYLRGASGPLAVDILRSVKMGVEVYLLCRYSITLYFSIFSPCYNYIPFRTLSSLKLLLISSVVVLSSSLLLSVERGDGYSY